MALADPTMPQNEVKLFNRWEYSDVQVFSLPYFFLLFLNVVSVVWLNLADCEIWLFVSEMKWVELGYFVVCINFVYSGKSWSFRCLGFLVFL